MKLTLWIINKIQNFFIKCDSCHSTGEKIGFENMQKACESCKCKREIFNCIKKNKIYILNNFWLYSSVFFLIITSFIVIFQKRDLVSNLSTMIPLLALVFTALKHSQDISEYHLKLFEERLKIFLIVDDVISNFNAFTKYKESKEEYQNRIENLISKITSIKKRSFFIFSEETHRLILRINENLIRISYDRKYEIWTQETGHAEIFLASLIDSNNLPEEFLELKISGF